MLQHHVYNSVIWTIIMVNQECYVKIIGAALCGEKNLL